MKKNFSEKEAQKQLKKANISKIWVVHVWSIEGHYQPVCTTVCETQERVDSILKYWNDNPLFLAVAAGPYVKQSKTELPVATKTKGKVVLKNPALKNEFKIYDWKF